MITQIGAGALFVALATLFCGVLLARSAARLCGVLLILAGITGVVGLFLRTRPAADTGALLLIVAGLVLVPAALWAYPRPRWQHPVDLILAAVLIAPGSMALLYSHDGGIVLTMGAVSFLALVAQTGWRLERSAGRERRALAWAAVSTAVATLISLTATFVSTQTGVIALSLVVLSAIPIGMVVGLRSPDTIDVQGLAIGASVGLALAFGYVAYFRGTVALLELAGLTPGVLALSAIGLAGGAMLHPISVQLRTVMDQLLFGGRPNPLDAATRVVDGIGTDPQEALDSLRKALKLPFVALQRDGDVLASSGDPVPHLRRIHCEDLVLVAGMRPGDLRLSPDDAYVLRLVTPLLAQLVRATELAAAVQRSRAQALAGIADERRRLRNELHDELGPTLTGIAFTTDAAVNRLPAQPEAAAELMIIVRSEVGNAINRVRGIVYGMRPPALDELGLIAAVQQQARTLGDGLAVSFVVDGELPALPAAVEVAAFRVVMEALTNVARHCQPAAATVTFDTRNAGFLIVAVTDAGGASTPWAAGVGLTSMRERVAELGGTLKAGPGPGGGCVRAQFPLRWVE